MRQGELGESLMNVDDNARIVMTACELGRRSECLPDVSGVE